MFEMTFYFIPYMLGENRGDMRLRQFVIVLPAFTLFTSVALSADLFLGTWRMNIEKSQFSPGPIPKPTGPNFTTIEAVENGLRFVSEGIDGKGRKTRGEYTVTFDGRDSIYRQIVDGKPDPDSAPSTVSLKKIDDQTIQLTFKAAGRVVLVSKLVVSLDGKTGTAQNTGINGDGSTSTGTIHYDKQ